MTTPSDTPRIHLDPDDFGCPYCGAIAGACSNYPNCPGNGRIDAPAAGQEAKFLSPEARIVQLERDLAAAQERIRTVEVECDDAVSALNMTGNEAQKELHRVVTEFARYRERAESALAQEREARRAACDWTQEDLDSDCWNTGCGNAFLITDGTPEENEFKHCCYCGKTLVQQPFVFQTDE